MAKKAKEITKKAVAKYIKNGDQKCPSCGSTNIMGDNFDTYVGHVEQEMCCQECGLEWIDKYRLVDVTVIEREED